jgi:hypothetical protein
LKNNTPKNRAESVPICKALDLIEKLKLTREEYAIIFCGLKNKSQFFRWQKRGYMPAKNYWASQNELAKYFKKEYDRKCEIVWGDYEV